MAVRYFYLRRPCLHTQSDAISDFVEPTTQQFAIANGAGFANQRQERRLQHILGVVGIAQ
jgi:hypothetical protein